MERTRPLGQMMQLRPRVQSTENLHLQVHRENKTTLQGHLVSCHSGDPELEQIGRLRRGCSVLQRIVQTEFILRIIVLTYSEMSMPDIPGEANPQNLVPSQAQIQDLFASIQDLKRVFTTELEDIKEKLKDLTTKWEELRSMLTRRHFLGSYLTIISGRMQDKDDMDDDPFLWTHVQTPDSVISNTKI